MNKSKNILRIAALPLIATILLIPMEDGTQTFAQEKPNNLNSVNDIALQAIFHFRERVEMVDTFKLFDTMSSGFDRTKAVNFRLEGIIGGEKPMLYKAIDYTFAHGKNQNHDFSEFDVDIIFHRDGIPQRQFIYSDCEIKNYNAYTEYDKEETYNLKTSFVYLDRIEFECRGFALGNPLYDSMTQAETDQKTAEALKNFDRVKAKNGQ